MVHHLFASFLWILSSFGTWANPDGTIYPESKIMVTRNILVGKLDCAGRLLDYEHFQSWCFKGTRLVYNQVTDISKSTVATSYYYDNKPDEVDAMITWLVAFVEGNPKTVSYQVSYMVAGVEKPYIAGAF